MGASIFASRKDFRDSEKLGGLRRESLSNPGKEKRGSLVSDRLGIMSESASRLLVARVVLIVAAIAVSVLHIIVIIVVIKDV